MSVPFLDYFLNAFKYRQLARQMLVDNSRGGYVLPLSVAPAESEINAVEDNLIESFLALALKLPLDDFKPMFYRLFNLAMMVSYRQPPNYKGSACLYDGSILRNTLVRNCLYIFSRMKIPHLLL